MNLIKSQNGKIFIPASKKKKGSSAYYEFQYCKVKEDRNCSHYTYWAKDSLLMHIDFDSIFFKFCLPFFQDPISPDKSNTFCCYAPNYYTRERTAQIIEELKASDLTDKDTLITWLSRAVEEYNGFYFLGI